MTKIGLTGGFGTGKTTVLGFFAKLGARTFDADLVVRRELAGNAVLRKKIRRVFGPGVFKGARLDRAMLARRVFSNSRLLASLNGLVHPVVKKRLLEYFRRNRKAAVVVAEIPLLFETDFYRFFDRTVCVKAGRQARKQRLSLQRRITPGEIARRARHQLPLAAKIARCDLVIDNNGRKKDTFQQVKTIMEEEKWKSSK
ncbi:MAG: dephospho-CoA kinase [Candidatus Omnitrophota bacterium]